MTIASLLTSIQATGNGVTTAFAFNNKVFAATDLVVTLIDTLGNQYPFTNFQNSATGLSYQVNNVDVDSGCQVVFSAPITNGWTVDMRTNVFADQSAPWPQSTSIKNQGSFFPELHEEAFDRAARIVQDLWRLTYTYGIHGPDIESAPWPALPIASLRKGLALMFDPSTGLPTVGVPTTQTLTAGLIGLLLYEQTAAELAAGVTPAVYQYPPGQLDRYLLNATPGTTPMDSALTAAVAQAQQTGGASVLIGNQYALANSNTVPAGITMEVLDTGSFTIASGKTLTINSAFRAIRNQVFFGPGNVIMGAGSVVEAYPEWWGAVPNSSPTGPVVGTDCTAALNACIAACSLGSQVLGTGIGVVPIRLASGYYYTGNVTLTPALIMRGAGRKASGLLAKAGTTGNWLVDNGNAAGIILEDFALYGNSANASGISSLLNLGNGNSQWGSEGYLRGLWPRDCACSGGGFTVDLNGNIGFVKLISIYSPATCNATWNGMRVLGSGNMIDTVAILGPGSSGTGTNGCSFYEGNTGGTIHGLEIEAPQTCNVSSAPLHLSSLAFRHGVIISLASGTTFDHLVELGATAYAGTLEVTFFNNSAVAVSGGNIYNIAKTSYAGGNCGSSSNSPGQGSGPYNWPSGTLISGSASFSAQTAVTVTFPFSQAVSTYRVALCQSATSTSPPWVTAKSVSGFTINFSANFTGTVDWAVTVD